MLSFFSVYVLLAWRFGQAACTSDYVQRQIIESIDNVCPYANVCRPRGWETNVHFLPGAVPCCTECSCSESCSVDGNCCFPVKDSKDKYRNQTCMYSSLPEPVPEEQYLYASYYMYTQPPAGDGATCTGDAPTEGKPWGNLFPVYSKRTGKIYINEYTARCHGELQVTQWQARMFCGHFDAMTKRDTNLVTSVESIFSSSYNTNCGFQFTYPGDRDDIEQERCYFQITNSCGNVSFDIPAGINMSRDAIKHACENGFYSPYIKYALYQNVFCYICNGNRFFTNEQCNDVFTRTPGGTSVTFLLDPSVIRNLQNNYQHEVKEDQQMACPNARSPLRECRIVLCPSGQLKSITGTCVWPFQQMLTDNFALCLKLVPDIPIPVHGLNRSNSPLSWLISPWPKAWEIRKIYYQVTADNTPTVRHFWVDQRINAKGKGMESLMRKIRKTVRTPWKTSMGNVTIELVQEFDDNLSPHGGIATFRLAPNTRLLYDSRGFARFAVYLNKMIFCDQVELLEHEYTMAADNKTVTYTRTNRTLEAADYSLTVRGGRNRIRICLEDSGFILRSSGFSGYKLNYETTVFTILAVLLYC